MRWDAARLASRRELPKPRKMHGPVGDSSRRGRCMGGTIDDHCLDCGYHVCNCDRVSPHYCWDCHRDFRCTLAAFKAHDCSGKANQRLVTNGVSVPQRCFFCQFYECKCRSVITVPIGTVVSVQESGLAVVRVGGASTAEPAPPPTFSGDKPDPGSELEKWCLLVAEAMKNASWFV